MGFVITKDVHLKIIVLSYTIQCIINVKERQREKTEETDGQNRVLNYMQKLMWLKKEVGVERTMEVWGDDGGSTPKLGAKSEVKKKVL